MTRRPTKPLLLALVLVLLVGGVAAWRGSVWWHHRCGAGSDLTDGGRGLGLQQPGQISVAPGTRGDSDILKDVRDEREQVLAQADDLGAPFGRLAGGRFYEDDADEPDVIAERGTVLAADGSGLKGTSVQGTLSRVTLPEGGATWSRGFEGHVPGGGLIGDRVVTLTLPEDRAPQIAAYDASTGDRAWCTELGDDFETDFEPTLISAEVDGDPVVAHQTKGNAVMLARVEADDGDPTWSRRLEQDRVESIDGGGGVVALSERDAQGFGGLGKLHELALNADGDSVHSIAQGFDAKSGDPLWRYPADQGSTELASVLGVDESGTTVLMSFQRDSKARDDVAASFVGIGPDGEVRWRHAVQDWSTAAALWGSRVVLSIAEGNGRYGLTALDVTTGEQSWTTRLPPYRGKGWDDVQPADAVAVGDRWVMPGTNRLFVLDPETGSSSVRELSLNVDGLEVNDDSVVLDVDSGLLVLDRADA